MKYRFPPEKDVKGGLPEIKDHKVNYSTCKKKNDCEETKCLSKVNSKAQNVTSMFRPPLQRITSEESSARALNKYKLKPIIDAKDNICDHSLIGSSYFLKLPIFYDSEKGINIPPDLDINSKQNINIFNNIKNNTYNIYNQQKKLPSLPKTSSQTRLHIVQQKPNFKKIFNVKMSPSIARHLHIPTPQKNITPRDCHTERGKLREVTVNDQINPFKIDINDIDMRETGFFQDVVLHNRKKDILSAPHIGDEQLNQIKAKLNVGKAKDTKRINRLVISNKGDSKFLKVTPRIVYNTARKLPPTTNKEKAHKKNDSELTFGSDQ